MIDMSQEKLTDEEKVTLLIWREQLATGEANQVHELVAYCNNKYQFAKTHSAYVKDWEKTKEKMQYNLKHNIMPPNTSPALYKLMITQADGIMEEKLKMVRDKFAEKFGESIYNYLGKDGKTAGFWGLFG